MDEKIEVDDRVKLVWLQPSGLIDFDNMYATTYPPQNSRVFLKEITHYHPVQFSVVKVWNDLLISKSAERYFNKITRNNQGNVKNDNL